MVKKRMGVREVLERREGALGRESGRWSRVSLCPKVRDEVVTGGGGRDTSYIGVQRRMEK